MKKLVSRLKEWMKGCLSKIGISSKKDLLFGVFIWLTGPIMLFIAFSQSVRPLQKTVLDLTVLTYIIGITATVICTVSTFYAIWGLFFKAQSFQGHTFNGKFSIIIGARNEQQVIGKIIKDILEQTYHNFELIVVCHNCDDNTYEIVNQIEDERIKPLELKNAPLGKASL